MGKEKIVNLKKEPIKSVRKQGIVLENRKIEPFQVTDKKEDTADNFIDILLFCINNPDPTVGFTPKTMSEAGVLYNKLEAVREDSEFSVTNAQLTKLKEAFNRSIWGKILPGVVALTEYMEEL